MNVLIISHGDRNPAIKIMIKRYRHAMAEGSNYFIINDWYTPILTLGNK
jgi:hypothetical protein